MERKRRAIVAFVLVVLQYTADVMSNSLYTAFQNQRFAMEPQNQTAVVGARVTLPCRVVNKQGVLQWTKDDFGLGTSRDLNGFERYSMIGSDDEGDYSLEIYPVMLDDDAHYQCQVSPGPEGQPAIRSSFATLTVLVSPEPPKITQAPVLYTTEDRKIEIECISVGGKPAAEITWIDGFGNIISQEQVEFSVIPLPDMKRFSTKSVLHLIPKKEHHNTNFSCQAQNIADRTYRLVKIRVDVEYAPKVKVIISGSSQKISRIQEFQQLRLECKVEANPNDLRFRWYINDEPIIGGQKSEMIIRNVTRKFNGAIVKCEVQNTIGKSEDSETLDIYYAPVFRNRPRSIEADIGNIISLNCEVESNPTAEIIWIQHPTNRVVGTNSNLTFLVSNETCGRYYCKANVPGFTEITADAYVYLKGSPVISAASYQFGLIGDTTRIDCLAASVPRARHVSWTFNGQEINAYSGHDYSILVDAVPGGVKSTLIIRNSQAHHFGKYNCTIVNDYGNDVAEIYLQPQTSAIMTIISTIGGIILLIVVSGTVIIYSKCKKMTKLPPADVISEHQISKTQCISNIVGCKMETGDRSSNYSDLKVDISGGYVPYGDYSSHYSPPPQYLTTCSVTPTGSSTIMENNQSQNMQQQSMHMNLPLTILSNCNVRSSVSTSFNGNVTGQPDIRQDNGLPCLHSTTTSLVRTSPNGSCNNQSNTIHMLSQSHNNCDESTITTVDPRFSAIYGNPYLRSSNTSLLSSPTAV